MNKAIFLDRDGVINIERGDYTWRIGDFKFNKTIFEFLKTLQKKGYLFIIITNQGGIARGIFTHDDVIKLHEYMFSKFTDNDIEITDLYYCPHHSNVEKCLCRKPNSLMLEKAIAKYNIDIEKSYFIGDSRRDFLAGEKAGVKAIQVEKNSDLTELLKIIE